MVGGARENSGRKVWTDEQKAAQVERHKAARATRDQERRQFLLDELLYPAIVTAFHADPGLWEERYLEVELSKMDIKLAYGDEGVKEWTSFFSQKKVGGIDRFGKPYQTRWTMNINKYKFILKLINSMGHTIRDLPKVGFPPDAMIARVEAVKARRQAKADAKKFKGVGAIQE